MTTVTLLLIGTFVYAAQYVQGGVNPKASTPVVVAACRAATKSRVVTPRMVLVNVYNATSREGLASSVAESLQLQGFKIATIGNDPLSRTIRGVGEIRRGPSGVGGATLVAARLSGAKVLRDRRTDATVDLVLGNRFKVLRPPSLRSARATPSC